VPDRKPVESSGEPRRVARLERSLAIEHRGLSGVGEGIDLLPYLLILRDSWRMIVGAMAVTLVATFLITKYMITRSYRAMAILRPTPRLATQGRLAGLAIPDSLGSFAGLLSGRASDEAEEYSTILRSFAFTNALIEQHHIEQRPAGISFNPLSYLGSGENDPQWSRYRLMESQFSCEYSPKTGNITLLYEDRSAAGAQRVLDYYIDDLRDQLRRRDVQDATTAIASLKAEARATSDYLLQTQLYELIARQMQQLKLAEVQADFAFAVLEPPIAPRKAYRPSLSFDCALAALLGAFAASVWVLAIPRRPRLARSQELSRAVIDDDGTVLNSKVL